MTLTPITRNRLDLASPVSVEQQILDLVQDIRTTVLSWEKDIRSQHTLAEREIVLRDLQTLAAANPDAYNKLVGELFGAEATTPEVIQEISLQKARAAGAEHIRTQETSILATVRRWGQNVNLVDALAARALVIDKLDSIAGIDANEHAAIVEKLAAPEVFGPGDVHETSLRAAFKAVETFAIAQVRELEARDAANGQIDQDEFAGLMKKVVEYRDNFDAALTRIAGSDSRLHPDAVSRIRTEIAQGFEQHVQNLHFVRDSVNFEYVYNTAVAESNELIAQADRTLDMKTDYSAASNYLSATKRIARAIEDINANPDFVALLQSDRPQAQQFAAKYQELVAKEAEIGLKRAVILTNAADVIADELSGSDFDEKKFARAQTMVQKTVGEGITKYIVADAAQTERTMAVVGKLDGILDAHQAKFTAELNAGSEAAKSRAAAALASITYLRGISAPSDDGLEAQTQATARASDTIKGFAPVEGIHTADDIAGIQADYAEEARLAEALKAARQRTAERQARMVKQNDEEATAQNATSERLLADLARATKDVTARKGILNDVRAELSGIKPANGNIAGTPVAAVTTAVRTPEMDKPPADRRGNWFRWNR